MSNQTVGTWDNPRTLTSDQIEVLREELLKAGTSLGWAEIARESAVSQVTLSNFAHRKVQKPLPEALARIVHWVFFRENAPAATLDQVLLKLQALELELASANEEIAACRTEANGRISALEERFAVSSPILKPRTTVGDASGRCFWHLTEDQIWQSGCGESFVFNADGPKDNSFRHCPYCGGALYHTSGVMHRA